MSKTNAELTVRWMNEVWNERREATVGELLNDESIGHLEGNDTRGAEEFRKVRATLLSAMPNLRITIEETVAQGDSVVARWSVTAKHSGDGFGFAASGKDVQFRGMTWFKFKEGRITEAWDAWNQGALIAHLQEK